MNSADTPTSESLEKRHPAWQVWQSDTGVWWATVRGNLTPAQVRNGCVPYLSASSLDDLATLLGAEDASAGRSS